MVIARLNHVSFVDSDELFSDDILIDNTDDASTTYISSFNQFFPTVSFWTLNL